MTPEEKIRELAEALELAYNVLDQIEKEVRVHRGIQTVYNVAGIVRTWKVARGLVGRTPPREDGSHGSLPNRVD